MQKELFKRKELLEEIRRFQANQFEEIDVAKRAVQSIMATASIIVSVVAAFIATNYNACAPSCIGGLKVAAIFYIILVGVSVKSLSPLTLRTPMEMSLKNMEVYYRRYKTEIPFMNRVIDRYLVAIQENQSAVDKRKSLATWAGLLLGLMVFFLLLPQLGG
ncbi:MAG: hypothetical protein WD751_10975 [Anaerolineales bacterium]